MSNIPSDLRYAKSHEWLKSEADGTATVGITDYAQNSLGDITYVQLPKPGQVLKAGGGKLDAKVVHDMYDLAWKHRETLGSDGASFSQVAGSVA